jgi:hypothetical protein
MIESLEVRSAEPFGDYPYEWVSAVAHYAVDLDAPGSDRIADLRLARRDGDGKVRFRGDLVLVRPTGGGNRRAIVSVPNRGMVSLPYCGSGGLPAGVRNRNARSATSSRSARRSRRSRSPATRPATSATRRPRCGCDQRSWVRPG